MEILFIKFKYQGNDLNLYKFILANKEIDYFDENGKSMRKTLMKTPINGARLSSPFGKRKHLFLDLLKCIQEPILLHQLELNNGIWRWGCD